MKVAAALLRQWYNDNPARLLQAALWQAERLAEMAPQLEALRTENASLHQQLEAKTKRLAQVEKALQAAEREAIEIAARRAEEPFLGGPAGLFQHAIDRVRAYNPRKVR